MLTSTGREARLQKMKGFLKFLDQRWYQVLTCRKMEWLVIWMKLRKHGTQAIPLLGRLVMNHNNRKMKYGVRGTTRY
jgi:hypothetical protein